MFDELVERGLFGTSSSKISEFCEEGRGEGGGRGVEMTKSPWDASFSPKLLVHNNSLTDPPMTDTNVTVDISNDVWNTSYPGPTDSLAQRLDKNTKLVSARPWPNWPSWRWLSKSHKTLTDPGLTYTKHLVTLWNSIETCQSADQDSKCERPRVTCPQLGSTSQKGGSTSWKVMSYYVNPMPYDHDHVLLDPSPHLKRALVVSPRYQMTSEPHNLQKWHFVMLHLFANGVHLLSPLPCGDCWQPITLNTTHNFKICQKHC